MADSKLLVPELNEAETMGTETARFQELLLQVRADRDSSVPGNLSPPPPAEMGLQFPECSGEATGSKDIVVIL